MSMRSRRTGWVALVALLLVASGCSLIGQEDDGKDSARTVTLVTHESFALPEELIEEFEDETGYDLKVNKYDDAGALTNQLVLTKADPLGDVVFGVDNTFATRAIDEGVFEPYAPDLPQGAEDDELAGDDGDALTPIDTASVCVNVDDAWFKAKGLAAPKGLADLVKPAYKDLLVTPSATSSSPGMAFLLATIQAYGDEWPGYWERLIANGARVVKGWSDAYYTDFTFSGGDRPIVVSYDSSPAFTLNKAGTASTTSALLDECFRQVEYAGVLRGEDTDVEGARAVIDWLLSADVQSVLPEQMYVFPVSDDVELPDDWAAYAPQPEVVEQVEPADIASERADWLEQWNEIITR